ncbi:hypothetical protein [Nostoc sp.]|uniref:hypothetical protein n=1 Tax=Nostoc sp. TaxID=1180 RepID=UPI002FF89F76
MVKAPPEVKRNLLMWEKVDTLTQHGLNAPLPLTELSTLHTPPICHYHVHHCKLLTLLSQLKNLKLTFLQSTIGSQKN